MLTFSFAYDAVQDRIWLRLNNQDELIWLTRRLTVFLLTLAADRFAQAAGGGLDGLVNQDKAVELEHELAVTENDDQQKGTPVQMGASNVEPELKSHGVLCERITMSSNASGVQLQLKVNGDEKRYINLSRAGFHRMLRALLLVANRVKWDLPEVPAWLSRAYLPAALQGVVDSAMSGVELSDEDAEAGGDKPDPAGKANSSKDKDKPAPDEPPAPDAP
jgi:hypothetical protein